MNKVAIFTDSCADLSPELYKERNIHVIPFFVSLNGEEYLDGVNMNAVDLLTKSKELNVMPQTAAPSPHYFKEHIEPLINEGYDCVYVGIGKELSQAYKNITQVEELLEKGRFYHFDSMNISSAIGIQALKACDLRDQGFSAKEIVEKLAPLSNNMHLDFTVLSLDYLKKGGRVSSFKAFVGTFLRAKPIMVVRNGHIKAKKTVLGKYDKAYNYIVDSLEYHYKNNNLDLNYLTISHTGNPEGAKYLEEKIKALNIPFKNFYITPMGCTIAAHSGLKTIGIVYEVYDGTKEF